MKYFKYLCLVIFLQACSQEPNDLPSIPVKLIDGSTMQMDELEGKSMVVLYQPGCDHCQREAVQIQKNLESFNDYQVYFVSSSSNYENQQFAIEYKLNGLTNFHFGFALPEHIVAHYGSIPTPSVYVYSGDGKLQNEFIGETPIDKILSVL
ncbi:peroxiredoxin family protein [Fulvivirga sedimenti]|uniref:Redoxin domain-containing protein n=1 Tax=Fulvivirga sedimenti TaxID=2879465 RepID=A0A9X1HQ11_9BACT|nr:redoxin domain-containing protein [Fulvivirga sedimenti]MCA6074663.1 redoxin domain-containing protein [Fulvivirga sedimenti]MCA6075840.1 redoxin domain-containing protein [Fulvivirga sedimenti]MCA6076968.1 redoxin domain-containing protein [Fulvivirga sedimenti]